MKYGDIISNVTIEAMAAEGKCIFRHNGVVVFVPFAAPGDVADIKILKKDKKYYEGVIQTLHKPSLHRIAPVCTHFGTCGGCKWQHIPYETQLQMKQDHVADVLQRIAKVHFPPLQPILGCEQQYFYRNKLEFTFTDARWLEEADMKRVDIQRNGLGYHLPRRHDKVFDVRSCHLQPVISDQIRNFVKEFCIENNIPFYNTKNKMGTMRTMYIRTSETGQVMVIVQFYQNNISVINVVMDAIRKKFPHITSLLYTINDKGNDTLAGIDIHLHSGEYFIYETMGKLTYKISPKSFFQTNTKQAVKLYDIISKYADIKPDNTVYDLYTGTGTIANYIAHQAKWVIGIEYEQMAIDDAIENSKLNHITNTKFFVGDIAKVFNHEFMLMQGKPDIIITDPPRAGMHDNVLKALLNSGASTIVYVSCNPATQARDLALLDSKYYIAQVQPVDMFPQTHHVENVVKIQAR